MCSVETVTPWITGDVRKAKECHIDSMIRVMLLDCSVDVTKDAGDALFARCLESVGPICKGEVSKNENGCRTTNIQQHLEE